MGICVLISAGLLCQIYQYIGNPAGALHDLNFMQARENQTVPMAGQSVAPDQGIQPPEQVVTDVNPEEKETTKRAHPEPSGSWVLLAVEALKVLLPWAELLNKIA